MFDVSIMLGWEYTLATVKVLENHFLLIFF